MTPRQTLPSNAKQTTPPLTIADKRSHAHIMDELDATSIPVLSEEGRLTDYNIRKGWKTLWVVDPLDGTKEFIKRNGEFTVNIALVENGIPVLGGNLCTGQSYALFLGRQYRSLQDRRD